MASKAYPTPYSVGTTAKALVSPSPKRITLVIGQPDSGRITLSPSGDVTDLAGIVVQMGDPPLILTRCDDGCLVQGQLYAIADGASRNGSLIEVVEE